MNCVVCRQTDCETEWQNIGLRECPGEMLAGMRHEVSEHVCTCLTNNELNTSLVFPCLFCNCGRRFCSGGCGGRNAPVSCCPVEFVSLVSAVGCGVVSRGLFIPFLRRRCAQNFSNIMAGARLNGKTKHSCHDAECGTNWWRPRDSSQNHPTNSLLFRYSDS